MNQSHYWLRRSTANFFQQVYLCYEWPTNNSLLKPSPTQLENPMRQMTPCFSEGNGSREKSRQKKFLIHPFPWTFTHFFFFPNKYAFPHLSLCHARSHSSFFNIWSFCYLLLLQNYIGKWCINTSCFSQLEKSPCSILFLINTFSLTGAAECMRGDLTFSFYTNDWEVEGFFNFLTKCQDAKILLMLVC